VGLFRKIRSRSMPESSLTSTWKRRHPGFSRPVTWRSPWTLPRKTPGSTQSGGSGRSGSDRGDEHGGRRTAYKGSLSRNVIRIFGMDVMSAGLITPPALENFDILHVRDPKAKTYRKLVFRGDWLVGMVMVNGIEQGGVLMSLIQSETPIRLPKEVLLKPGFQFQAINFGIALGYSCSPPGIRRFYERGRSSPGNDAWGACNAWPRAPPRIQCPKTCFWPRWRPPRPKARVHVGIGLYNEGFPNRCRHCDPAPCLLACLPGAISAMRRKTRFSSTRIAASTAPPVPWVSVRRDPLP